MYSILYTHGQSRYYEFTMQMDSSAVLRIFIDLSCLAAVSVPILILKLVVTPFHRGFYCDDESLMHPHKHDTIPTWAAAMAAFSIPIICMTIIEGVRLSMFKRSCHCGVVQKRYFQVLYRCLGAFLFGAAVTQLTTDIAKYSLGRLRPHFLTVCKPDIKNCSAQTGYIETSVCTGTDLAAIQEARLSFPSGHTSITMYCFVYIMIYLQMRFKWRKCWLLRPFIQVLLFYMAYYTSLSRISDYMHHWSDVLGGAVVGLAVCLLVVFCVSDIFTETSCCKPVDPNDRPENDLTLFKPARHDDRLSCQTSSESTVSTNSAQHIIAVS
ncbi:phospholipid phosphatase 1-like isoform X1 [Mizuhopecten yessoensis]|uniref:Lipid phosphate phosphohydrolase 1 n=2 Tax=Mizuhopecten yessoensis TaxID=6573 RepID=A0A210PQ42_MIZYE|nr:phospholipid phosphatase 1-like isoform X1 [Mizuhopecten yessoensis]OWF38592.1 Lipid phosphate phosphohydrolase 1 [Mizuhopecten yessoensis]